MKHFPRHSRPVQIAGIEHAHAPVRVSLLTAVLVAVATFAAGFAAAVYTIGLIVTP